MKHDQWWEIQMELAKQAGPNGRIGTCRLRERDFKQRLAIAELRKMLKLRTDAIRWACGEKGEFPVRAEGQGAYWWRSTLRTKAGMKP